MSSTFKTNSHEECCIHNIMNYSISVPRRCCWWCCC